MLIFDFNKNMKVFIYDIKTFFGDFPTITDCLK